jgi:hypothetical protein
MPDGPVAIRRKIGVEGRYDGRDYAANPLTLRQNLSFQHPEKKAANLRCA